MKLFHLKIMKLIFILLIMIRINTTLIIDSDGAHSEKNEWDYERKGSEMWSFLMGSSCGGKSQSPIDISFTNLTCNYKSLKLLQLKTFILNLFKMIII